MGFFQKLLAFERLESQYDDSVQIEIKENIEKRVEGIASLRICADLCNRSKHLMLTKTIREDAQVTERSVIVHAPVLSMDNNENAKLKCTSTYEHVVTLGDGSKRVALEVARQAVKDWEKLLK